MNANPALDLLLVWLARITLLLTAAWCLHALLRRANPHWRLLLWRAVPLGLLAMPALVCFLPQLPLPLLPPVVTPPAELAFVAIPGSNFTINFAQTDGIGTITSLPLAVESAPSPAPDPFDPISWLLPWLSAVWLAGVCFMLLRLALAHVALRRLLRAAGPAPRPTQVLFATLAADLHVRGVALRVSPAARAPFVTGLFRPVIVLPAAMSEAPLADLAAVFSHEFVHLGNSDLLWLAVIRCVQALFWFHPLVWALHGAYSRECERICDHAAAAVLGSRRSYSGALARIALALAGQPLAPPALSMATPDIRRRLQDLKEAAPMAPLKKSSQYLSACCGMLLLGLLAACRLAHANEPKPAVMAETDAEAAADMAANTAAVDTAVVVPVEVATSDTLTVHPPARLAQRAQSRQQDQAAQRAITYYNMTAGSADENGQPLKIYGGSQVPCDPATATASPLRNQNGITTYIPAVPLVNPASPEGARQRAEVDVLHRQVEKLNANLQRLAEQPDPDAGQAQKIGELQAKLTDAVQNLQRAEMKLLQGQNRIQRPARFTYEQTGREHPEDVFARNGRAETLKELGRLDEALAAHAPRVSMLAAPDLQVDLMIANMTREQREEIKKMITEKFGPKTKVQGNMIILNPKHPARSGRLAPASSGAISGATGLPLATFSYSAPPSPAAPSSESSLSEPLNGFAYIPGTVDSEAASPAANPSTPAVPVEPSTAPVPAAPSEPVNPPAAR